MSEYTSNALTASVCDRAGDSASCAHLQNALFDYEPFSLPLCGVHTGEGGLETLRAADLFCGAGGTSSGLMAAAQRFGLSVDLVAINHWTVAIATHTTNHPGVRHYCMSIEDVDPIQAVPGGHLHLLCASPECIWFSRARGAKPINDQRRSSPWKILEWCQKLTVDHLLIENVQEFTEWGPLYLECSCGSGVDAKKHIKPCLCNRPIPERKGEFYQDFLAELRSLGYVIETRILMAADYGDPTSRKRLFIQANRTGRPITWPRPTYGTEARPYRTAREIIDWSIKGESIYTRKKPLAPNTMERILVGLRKFGLQPFLAQYFGGKTAISLDAPLPTVTANYEHYGLCEPFLFAMEHSTSESGHDRRIYPVDRPLPTLTTRAAYGLAEPYVVVLRNHCNACSLDEPLPVVCAGGQHLGLAEPYLIEYHGGNDHAERTRSLDQPLPTQDTSNRFGLCEPYLVSYYGTGQALSLDEPIDTITTHDRFGLCEPSLFAAGPHAKGDGQTYLVDILFRMLQPHELGRAQGFGDDYIFHGTQGQKIAQIGNAVPVYTAEALITEILDRLLKA